MRTYEELIMCAAEDGTYLGEGMDDYDKGALEGIAFALALVFDKRKHDVKNDIRGAYSAAKSKEA